MSVKNYEVCPNCGVKVFKTKTNPTATCEYRHCRHDRKDDSTAQTDEKYTYLCNKYVGKAQFVAEVGAPLRCVDIKYPNRLVCMSDWHPDQYIFTPEEFECILKNRSLPH